MYGDAPFGAACQHRPTRESVTAQSLLVGAVLAATFAVTSPAFAGANDYVFEPVTAEMKQGDDVVVAVRLKHKASGRPVTDAVIFLTRIDMAPDAMEEMASSL